MGLACHGRSLGSPRCWGPWLLTSLSSHNRVGFSLHVALPGLGEGDMGTVRCLPTSLMCLSYFPAPPGAIISHLDPLALVMVFSCLDSCSNLRSQEGRSTGNVSFDISLTSCLCYILPCVPSSHRFNLSQEFYVPLFSFLTSFSLQSIYSSFVSISLLTIYLAIILVVKLILITSL